MTSAVVSANGRERSFMAAGQNPRAEADGTGRPAPRRVLGFRRARLVSWGLFGLAAALAAIFLVHVAKFESTAPSRPEAPADAPASHQVVVTHSTLTGYDDDRQPYSVTAASAVQDSAEPNRVRLTTVAGELSRRSGDSFSLAASSALFDSKTEMLELDGEVQLVAAGRFVAAMDKADVTLRDKRLSSRGPVSVTFGRGAITAGGLEITEDGNRVVFLNRVKVTFGPQTKGDRLQ